MDELITALEPLPCQENPAYARLIICLPLVLTCYAYISIALMRREELVRASI